MEKFKLYFTLALGVAILLYLVGWRFIYREDLEMSLSTGLAFGAGMLLMFAPKAFSDMLGIILKNYFGTKSKKTDENT